LRLLLLHAPYLEHLGDGELCCAKVRRRRRVRDMADVDVDVEVKSKVGGV
jgi:hypothetical protein